tara:strand:+ start:6906 stop:8012 length:1107 start_codon:yes stop_codon:yes gene_type:complete
MPRILTLTLTLLYCFPAISFGQIHKLSWITDAQTPPTGEFEIAPLSHWQANLDQVVTTRRGWEKPASRGSRSVRLIIEQRWLDYLGPLATQPRTLPKLEVLERKVVDQVERTLVKYEILPGDFVEAYILKPIKLQTKVPGIVVLHSTVENSIDLPAGIDGRPEEYHGLGAAQRGMVAIVPRNYLWPTNYGIKPGEMAADFLKKYSESKGMARMLYDSLVATDILEAMPEVDSRKLGCVGHSLGAKEVLYLAAFDKRIKATVFSEGGIGTRFSNWDAPWYLGDSINQSFHHDHEELLALIAPRPFLLIAGDSADGDRSWPYIAKAMAVYKFYTNKPAIAFYNHRTGHPLTKEAEKRSYQWLTEALNHSP